MKIVDTSALLAYFNTADPNHERAAREFSEVSEKLVVSPFVVAELDYMISTRVGPMAALAALDELTSAAYVLAPIEADDLAKCREVIERFDGLDIGVTDASLVVLADRHSTRRIMTFDLRHFSVLRSADGQAFELLPTV